LILIAFGGYLAQSAALMAVGLLYQGSAHRLTTEILLAEIGRKPGGDNALDREGYALAAGLALGLVTLGNELCQLIAVKPLCQIVKH
jgi:hypothetical protein